MNKITFAFLSAVLLAGTLLVSSCAKKQADDKTISLAVTKIKIYEDTAKAWAKEVEKLGYKLDIRSVGVVQLNEVVERGEIFATYHQHTAFLKEWNALHKGHLAAAFPIFIDRAGVFSLKHKSIKDLPAGATFLIPPDIGNNFRTFKMLADAGLIKIRTDIAVESVSVRDVTDNPKQFKFVEVDYEILERTLSEVDAGFMYATNAAAIGLDVNKDALLTESKEFWVPDIIAVRQENLNSPKSEILKKAYYTDSVKQAMKDSFDGKEIVLPLF
jgi:D-methionine transport system substrate-binding protein